MSFSQALSGLRAAADNLGVVGNNIANAQTVGFKSSGIQFSDVYADSQGGLGTRVAAIVQNFNEGNLETTNRSLDLAITGNGFFRFTQNNEVMYSRNGQLTMTNEGFLVNASGARLTGYPADSAVGTQPEQLRVPSGGLQAQQTNEILASFNMDARAEIIDPAATPFDINDPDTYHYANTVTIYDSLGNSSSAQMYFTKVADNEWQVRLARDGEVAPEVGTMEFDSNGILATTNGLDNYTFNPGGGAEQMNVAMTVTGTTQFANEFELNNLQQDGYTSGTLVRVAIEEDGSIVGTYTNEQSQVLGTVALASFRNMEGLRAVGDNSWLETPDSGPAIIGLAGEGQFGTIASGVVEQSNVDLTQELVALIMAQRNYQANAQSIKTQDEVLQATVNLR
ncbi:flagellar hook protein FlgE [Aliidiomarina iranensis]|uniref:Flagellar hook protein FlgE n=1 Tax=Aliidiomarina iranensis TaxID=1434071 RepID=A0A432W1T4_9GAMM|nr:flagellar hook protein FlgE [Aliidiomarina iranensis]RUO23189.1 flagellar hook protein FlgE [Aliidiomarina iranensis]